ncbi:hypothetical protein PUG46_14430 [Erwiniaceae bacterium L1_55_4]|nr:hypothetical protein [Erwiniaceae bacterium L1_55_4]
MEKVKRCIFCNNPPKNKNKEHVIPQWLIKMTGDPGRNINLGTPSISIDSEGNYSYEYQTEKTTKEKGRKFPFKNFTFPACESCNSEFGNIESKIKPIYEKIESGKDLSNEETSLFLDWMDKVRVGIWHGLNQLNKTSETIKPKFGINFRAGAYDRVLMFKRLKESKKGINLIGVETLSFHINPCAFGLRINGLLFLNISSAFLISENLGFPYISEYKANTGFSGLYPKVMSCSASPTTPILPKNILSDYECICQPMFREITKDPVFFDLITDLYNNEHIKSNCINYSEGTGSIFKVTDKTFTKIERKTEIGSASSFSDLWVEINKLNLEVLLWQNLLMNKTIGIMNSTSSGEYFNREDGLPKASIRINDDYIKILNNHAHDNLNIFLNHPKKTPS